MFWGNLSSCLLWFFVFSKWAHFWQVFFSLHLCLSLVCIQHRNCARELFPYFFIASEKENDDSIPWLAARSPTSAVKKQEDGFNNKRYLFETSCCCCCCWGPLEKQIVSTTIYLSICTYVCVCLLLRLPQVLDFVVGSKRGRAVAS